MFSLRNKKYLQLLFSLRYRKKQLLQLCMAQRVFDIGHIGLYTAMAEVCRWLTNYEKQKKSDIYLTDQ